MKLERYCRVKIVLDLQLFYRKEADGDILKEVEGRPVLCGFNVMNAISFAYNGLPLANGFSTRFFRADKQSTHFRLARYSVDRSA